MSSGNFVTHARRGDPPPPWTDDQTQTLVRLWRDLSDVELSMLLSRNGPKRSTDAVAEKRRVMGLFRPTGQQDPRASGRAYEASRLQGWPAMRGTPEEREERYQKALHQGLREERMRLYARSQGGGEGQ